MAQRPSESAGRNAVTAEPVHVLSVQVLTEGLPLGVAGHRYTDADRYHVVVAAAAQERSIASVCHQLVNAPSAHLVRHSLLARLFEREDLDTLEARCNALLVSHLPPGPVERPLRLAIDLTLLPYDGAEGLKPDPLRRGEARAGTTRFHCDATASVLHAGRRVTRALTFVRADEALLDVLADLLDRLRRLGVRLQRLFLDREFASVAILRHLDQPSFTAIVALPKRGQRLKALLVGRASDRTTDTMRSAEDGEITFPWSVACR